MLQKLKITSCTFILCLFGLTFIGVAPSIAKYSPEYIACQQIKPQGDFQLMKQKKNCFRDLARSLMERTYEAEKITASADIRKGRPPGPDMGITKDFALKKESDLEIEKAEPRGRGYQTGSQADMLGDCRNKYAGKDCSDRYEQRGIENNLMGPDVGDYPKNLSKQGG
jgi:hypothetical protein